MFTGIVEELGTVVRPGPSLAVEARKVSGDSEPGSSLAVNGVCLTVVECIPPADGPGPTTLVFELSPETLARSSLGALDHGDRVNLERPVTLLTRLGGHLVQGHVDGLGTIASVRDEHRGRALLVEVADGLNGYVVEKGSVAIDGVSLTVTQVTSSGFGVVLVPFTLGATTLGAARPGDRVNVEVDVFAKYVERFVRSRQ